MADERKQQILEILNLQGRLTVEELVEKLDVTAVTIRADLDGLAESGQLMRSRGGALKPEELAPEYPFSIREHLHKAEKQRIAKAADASDGAFAAAVMTWASTHALAPENAIVAIRLANTVFIAVLLNGLSVTAPELPARRAARLVSGPAESP